MSAILIHFAGFMLINLLMPDWAVEAETGYLAYWYAGFALIDMIALSFCYSRAVQIILAVSCSWSLAIVLEMFFVQDDIQRHDWIAQYALDASLLIAFAYLGAGKLSAYLNERKGIKA